MSPRRQALAALFLLAAALAAAAILTTDTGGQMGRHGINPPKP